MSEFNPKRGEVWFVEFPLEEDETKILNRPVIVLSEQDEELEVLSVKITKHSPRDKWDYPILYWEEASLKLASTARISKTIFLSTENFIRKLGELNLYDLEKVDELFREYIDQTRDD